jgi:hypothetical protein
MTSNIASINSKFANFQDRVRNKFDAMDNKFTGKFDTIKSTLNHLLNRSHGPPFFEQLSHLDGVEYSHTMAFQSNSFHHDLHLIRVEVNKFDGLDPTGSVTQMKNYFSLHGITNELEKIHYGVLCLYHEHRKWHKNACHGYVA